MRFSGRAVLCVLVLVGTTGAFKACSTKATSGGQDPPRTADDIVQATASAATSVDVLGNDQNLANEPLTFSIDTAPFVGSASFNSDRTVRLDLPASFRGVTRFKYKVTNALGGFSISTAVVFVDVPAYRVLFAAKDTSQAYELYVNDLVAPKPLSTAKSGNLRLRTAYRSTNGSLVVYERADPAQVASTLELFYVKTTPIGTPVKISQPAGRQFISATPVAISDSGRWLALATNPTTSSGQSTNLYVHDINSSDAPLLVGLSENLLTNLTQWIGDQPTLYFMAAPRGTIGPAVYRASTGNLDSPQRVSPFYPTSDSHVQMLVSADETKLVLVGTHSGQNGAFFIDLANPTVERRLTTDVPAGAVIESFSVNKDFTELTYLWRLGTSTSARLSVAPIAATGLPSTVFNGGIASFSELRPDGVAALITRSTSGRLTDGDLYEVSLDGSTADVRVASNVSFGAYDDTGDRVYLNSRTLAPGALERSDFGRTITPLVRSTTPSLALFVTPSLARSAAILEDPTSGLVLVNAAAPGKTFRLSTLDVGTVPSTTLSPTAIVAAP